MRKLGAVLLLLGCGGDPRLPFVGSYRGTSTFTYLDNGRMLSDNITIGISAPAKSNRLTFDTNCEFTAEPIDAETIEMHPISCPPRRSATVNGNMATYTSNFDKGVGNLVGSTLSITQTGTQLVTDISDGSADTQFQFRSVVVMTRL